MWWDTYQLCLLALVIWREARGEPNEGKQAVAHVIRNRVLRTPGQNQWDHVITAKWQFSSMTAPGDRTLVEWPTTPDPQFEACMLIASDAFNGVGDDPTFGATHYANLKVCNPAWAKTMKVAAVIGNHTFFA